MKAWSGNPKFVFAELNPGSSGSAVPVWAAGDLCFYLPREDFMPLVYLWNSAPFLTAAAHAIYPLEKGCQNL